MNDRLDTDGQDIDVPAAGTDATLPPRRLTGAAISGSRWQPE